VLDFRTRGDPKQLDAIVVAGREPTIDPLGMIEPLMVRIVIGLGLVNRMQGSEAGTLAQEPARAGDQPPAAIAQEVGIVENIEHFAFDVCVRFRVGDRELGRFLADRPVQILIIEFELGHGILCVAFVPGDIEP